MIPAFNRLINRLFAPARPAFSLPAVITQGKQFPDVSFYQGAIDWDKMSAETDAIIIRAGQNTWEDTEFATSWVQAKARGIYRGAYWFYDDRTDPGRQADKLVSLIQYDLPEMEVWIDWENTYGGAFGGLRNVVAMMQKVEQALPVFVGLYTGFYWFTSNSNAITNAAQYAYLKNKPLWEAWYTDNPAVVKVPAPWTSLLLWQFGTPAEGYQYGAKTKELDMNEFNGDFLGRYFAAQPTGGDMYQGKTGSDGAKVWSKYTNGVLSDQITPIKAGVTVTGAAPAGGVVQLATPTVGYTKFSMLTGYTAVVPPPPPPPDPEPDGDDLPAVLWIGATKETVTEYRKAA